MHQSLAPYRLRSQRLTGAPLADATAVVRHLGAVQSQEHTTVPWSIARRCGTPPLADVLDALRAGGVVRTHVLRTTWHHVHVDDLPRVVAATSDRVMGQLATHVRRQGLEEPALAKASEVVVEAVRDAPGCTRDDVAARLDEAGTPFGGDLLAHVVMAAELRGEVAGRRDPGGPHRYQPLRLAPSTAGVDADRAWLAATYARGHGPFAPADLAWWSSLTLTQARRAVADAGLHEVELEGRRLWSPHPLDELRDSRADVPAALLLSQFDELVSYARDVELRAEVGAGYTATMSGAGLLVLDGRLAGHWSRSVRADTLTVVVHTDAALHRRHRSSLDREAAALAGFHGLADVVVTVA
ncbi:DNA glycosylase AlkZ-like family protein [Aeromicrobium sp.]|uniref:DNA glycosylase AlkZ-like family protein n=1 Tax=Aeromicrobium sp. TaxID=1871063 RepID=UPI0035190CC8